jgi:hypothetical protein
MEKQHKVALGVGIAAASITYIYYEIFGTSEEDKQMFSNKEDLHKTIKNRRIIDAAKKSFTGGDYSSAIHTACIEFLNIIRDKALILKNDSKNDNQALIDKVFRGEHPILTLNIPNEKYNEAIEYFSSIIRCFRNPTSHNNINITKESSLKIIAIISKCADVIEQRSTLINYEIILPTPDFPS